MGAAYFATRHFAKLVIHQQNILNRQKDEPGFSEQKPPRIKAHWASIQVSFSNYKPMSFYLGTKMDGHEIPKLQIIAHAKYKTV